MRLRTLLAGNWRIVTPVDHRDRCQVKEDLDELARNRATQAVAAGLRAIWKNIPPEGPHQLPDVTFHNVDANNEIYEFIKGRYRVLCFKADGRLVVCTSVFMKATQKTPRREIDKAVEIRGRYLAAQLAGQVVVE